jgi:RNA polymerase sigma-70 factor (ECF subfamily)
LSDGEVSLVDAARRRERAAFEQLVRNVTRLLFAHLYLKTRDSHRAEDLVQETLLLAWKRIETLQDSGSFRAWIIAIANSVYVDSLRRDSRRKRKAPPEDPAALESACDGGLSPSARSEQADERQRVLSVLQSMPDEYRQVLSLRYLSGADYQQISRQLALSNGSLRGLLQRGLKMLRDRMSQHDSARSPAHEQEKVAGKDSP